MMSLRATVTIASALTEIRELAFDLLEELHWVVHHLSTLSTRLLSSSSSGSGLSHSHRKRHGSAAMAREEGGRVQRERSRDLQTRGEEEIGALAGLSTR